MPLPAYLVQPEPMSFAVRLRPVAGIAAYRPFAMDALERFPKEQADKRVNLSLREQNGHPRGE